MTSFWTTASGSTIMQGDLLSNCIIPAMPTDLLPTTVPVNVAIKSSNLIVVTQSCDLADMKTGFVALCPFHSVSEFELINPTYKKKGVWEEVWKGRREGLHLLSSPTSPDLSRESLVVIFREIYSLPIAYLQVHAASMNLRWRLQSPFLEHFSQAFARFFMRVGLPSSVPAFTN